MNKCYREWGAEKFNIPHEKYEFAEAKVLNVSRTKEKWNYWVFTIQFTQESCKELRIMPEDSVFGYRLSTKHFSFVNIPREGDMVKVRCRLTDENPFFMRERAFIVEVIK